MRLEGKVAVVTGAGRGIGRAVALALAAEGAKVVVNYSRSADAAEAVAAQIRDAGGEAVAFQADVADAPQVQALVGAAKEKYGALDILVNNAGVQHVSPVEDFPTEKWDQVIAINLSAAFHAIKAAVPAMKERGWGRIISTASAHSLAASPFKSAYVSAKHGLVGLTRTVALELATRGVTVNCISPGYVWTPLVERQIPDTMRARGLTKEQVINDVLLAAQPTRQFVTPDQVAALAVFLCSDAASQITGANLSMDGGWTAA